MKVETYSRTENGHTRIWNVKRLIELAKALPRKELAVSAIKELDSEMWFGGPRGVRPTCREVAEHARRINAADLSYPIILSANGRVMDGMHRVASAWMECRETITAVQFPVDPPHDQEK